MDIFNLLYIILFFVLCCEILCDNNRRDCYSDLVADKFKLHRVKGPPRLRQLLRTLQSRGNSDINSYSDRVVGGQITMIKFYPYQVYVHPGCGGSIIGRRWVLTAAHCYNSNLTTVYVGSSTKMKGTPIKVRTTIEMPKLFLSTNIPHFDFMLLELDTDLVYGPTVQPIQIAREEDIVVGKYGILTGFGRTSENGDMNMVLREVALPIIDLHKCKHQYAKFGMEVLSTEFCAGYDEGQRDGCQGDSGGPFAVDGKLIGVTSYGRGCARAGSPGVFASVPRIRSWIYEITGIS